MLVMAMCVRDLVNSERRTAGTLWANEKTENLKIKTKHKMKNEKLIRIEGKKLKEMRKLMGLKQFEVAKFLNTEQSCYSRMERGQLNSGDRLHKVTRMFNEWKEKEIIRLREQIQYLNSL